MGLQAAFHRPRFTAAACLQLEHRSVLAPAAGARRAAACSPLGSCADGPGGKAGLGLNLTGAKHAPAISLLCESAKGQKAPLSSCLEPCGCAWPKALWRWV